MNSPYSPSAEPSDPTPNQSTGGPASSLCTCDRPAVVRVWVAKLDEEFYFYRRCPSCEKEKALPFSISTLRELNRYMSINLTEEGRIYKKELEERNSHVR